MKQSDYYYNRLHCNVCHKTNQRSTAWHYSSNQAVSSDWLPFSLSLNGNGVFASFTRACFLFFQFAAHEGYAVSAGKKKGEKIQRANGDISTAKVNIVK